MLLNVFGTVHLRFLLSLTLKQKIKINWRSKIKMTHVLTSRRSTNNFRSLFQPNNKPDHQNLLWKKFVFIYLHNLDLFKLLSGNGHYILHENTQLFVQKLIFLIWRIFQSYSISSDSFKVCLWGFHQISKVVLDPKSTKKLCSTSFLVLAQYLVQQNSNDTLKLGAFTIYELYLNNVNC